MKVFTHAQLCAIAAKWLRRPHSGGGHGCTFAFTECRSGTHGEAPDAIGFRAAGWLDGSVVVECKVSRSDFLADAKKPHRREPGDGMGRWRYFLAPEGVVKPPELPAGWGLLTLSPRGAVRAVAGPGCHLAHHAGNHRAELGFGEACATWAQPFNAEREVALLVKLLARVNDPEKVNLMLREANGRASRAWEEVSELRTRCANLRNELWQARLQVQVAGTNP